MRTGKIIARNKETGKYIHSNCEGYTSNIKHAKLFPHKQAAILILGEYSREDKSHVIPDFLKLYCVEKINNTIILLDEV